MPKRYDNGLLIGKFLPPHRGHDLSIDFGSKMCDNMYVIVSGKADDYIPVSMRKTILECTHPNVHVYSEVNELEKPTYNEHGVAVDEWFWNHWIQKIEQLLPSGTLAIFTNDKYGEELADRLGADWLPIDPDREAIPISGTKLREDRWKHSKYLSDIASNYFKKKIAIVGPESSGKTTLAKQLANELPAGFVPEYGRTVSEQKGNELDNADFIQILKGHSLMVDAVSAVEDITIVDTEAYTTKLFADIYLDSQSDELQRELHYHIYRENYDLYLLLTPELDWIDDGSRLLDNQRLRWYFFTELAEYLKENNKNFRIIAGSNPDKRLETAYEYCLDLLK
jgi:NadR type nicotinamide-nucleotide adenylyltransferase